MISTNQMSKIKEYARECRWTDNEGYWIHITEVVKHALWLQGRHGGDKSVIEAAAWLHDVGKSKGRYDLHERHKEKHEFVSADMAREFLASIKVDKEFIEKVVDLIPYSHSGEDGNWPEEIEKRVLACADKMGVLTDSEITRRWYGKELTRRDLEAIIKIYRQIFNNIKNSPFPEAVKRVEAKYKKKLEKYEDLLESSD